MNRQTIRRTSAAGAFGAVLASAGLFGAFNGGLGSSSPGRALERPAGRQGVEPAVASRPSARSVASPVVRPRPPVSVASATVAPVDPNQPAARHAEGRPGATYTVNVYGGWVEPGCVPTNAAPPANGSTHLTVLCTLTYTGTWVAQAIERIDGELGSDFSVAATNDYWFVGRDADDNTCGSLHVRETLTTAPSGAAHAVGTIIGGTGDWAGSTGTVLIDGSANAGAGVGGYSGTWTRPGTPKAASPVPCVPPPASAVPPAN